MLVIPHSLIFFLSRILISIITNNFWVQPNIFETEVNALPLHKVVVGGRSPWSFFHCFPCSFSGRLGFVFVSLWDVRDIISRIIVRKYKDRRSVQQNMAAEVNHITLTMLDHPRIFFKKGSVFPNKVKFCPSHYTSVTKRCVSYAAIQPIAHVLPNALNIAG